MLYPLVFPIEALNLIRKGLGKLPHDEVAGLIGNMQAQIQNHEASLKPVENLPPLPETEANA